MREQPRGFSEACRAEAAQMLLQTGRPVAKIATDRGVNDDAVDIG